MTGRLDGKVAVITGGARGQGESHARRFVAEGAKVVIGDILDDLGKALADELGDAAIYQHLDVTSEAEWEQFVATAEREFGKVDILVNNAGVAQFGEMTHELSVDAYRRNIEINQFGVFIGMHATLPALLRNRGGSIVNISSAGGIVGFGGTIAYTAAKFAVRGMSKTAALEYGKAGIRVNSVHPGAVDTDLIRNISAGSGSGVIDETRFANVAMGRVGQPEDVTNLVLFLASDEAAYCTGAEYFCDGGSMAGTVNPAARASLD
ncbi:MAG: hypothetical protein JWN67_3251 [Actinomycetia bacterium]|nr:hypothetical protein [Actinomycetes bacterium]